MKLQLIIVSLNFSRTMSSRKYASGNDKRKKKKPNDMIESQRGLFINFLQNVIVILVLTLLITPFLLCP
jgi:hypothetical protein